MWIGSFWIGLSLVVLLALANADSGATCNPSVCPAGECCAANNTCGTSIEYCGIGCQNKFGPCAGSLDNFSSPFSASKDMKVAQIIWSPDQENVYVFGSFKGTFNVSINSTSTFSAPPLDGASSNLWNGFVLKYTSALKFVQFARIGTSASFGFSADVQIVGGFFANGFLRAVYNIGPFNQPVSKDFVSTIFMVNRFDQQSGLQGLNTTGTVTINSQTLLFSSDSSTSVSVSFSNFTTTDVFWDGSQLQLMGSFTASPLLNSVLGVNQTMGLRTSCVGIRNSTDFEWCAGAEDGWRMVLNPIPPTGSVSGISFLFSQSYGLSPSRVRSLSVSTDRSGLIYNCYLSNSPWIVDAVNSDQTAFTDQSTAFFRGGDLPLTIDEIFCTIRGSDTLSFTNLIIEGDLTSAYAVAIPTDTNRLYWGGSTTQKTLLNISYVQDALPPITYQLSESPAVSKVHQILGTINEEMVVTGNFKGSLTGDPLAPFPSPVNSSGTGNNFYFFYYNRTASPDEIVPHAFVAFGGGNTDFLDAHAYTPNVTSDSPIFILGSTYTSSSSWKYNNKNIRASPTGGVSYVWGLYNPQGVTLRQVPPPPIGNTPIILITPPSDTDSALMLSTPLALLLSLSLCLLMLM